MNSKYVIESITFATFGSLLKDYSCVVPTKARDFEEARWDAIPKAIKARSPKAYLTLEDLVQLVEWKLANGKFRPTLRKLIKQNSDEFVIESTTKAFECFELRAQNDALETRMQAAMKEVEKLRGVGPATATLILASLDPENVPFFSDELYRWATWTTSGGKGWEQSIAYKLKEYVALCQEVTTLKARLEAESSSTVNAADIEKVAYVLGKRPQLSMGTDDDEGGSEKVAKVAKVVKSAEVAEVAEIDSVERDEDVDIDKPGKQTTQQGNRKRPAASEKPAESAPAGRKKQARSKAASPTRKSTRRIAK